jgi:cell filamentation protein
MYDAINDPYTYKDSTVLVNKLDLRDQTELDAFEAEISIRLSAAPPGQRHYQSAGAFAPTPL